MKEHVQFGRHTIEFELRYAPRKTLGIKVNPDTSVEVSAPETLSLDKIHQAVTRKAMWILKQKSYFLGMDTVNNDIIAKSGYSVNYLGRRYKVMVEIGGKNEVSYKGNLFLVTVKKKSYAQKVLEQWLKEKAYQKITEIAKPIIKKFSERYKAPSEIYFQEMPTRWGSCTVKNKLIFNPRLIHTPKRCIEYVVMHELCHIVHKNHSQQFFELLTQLMPDWEKRKEKLDNYK